MWSLGRLIDRYCEFLHAWLKKMPCMSKAGSRQQPSCQGSLYGVLMPAEALNSGQG